RDPRRPSLPDGRPDERLRLLDPARLGLALAHRRCRGRDARGVLGELSDDRRGRRRGAGATSAPPEPRSSASLPGTMATAPLIERPPTMTPDFRWPDFDRWQAAFAATDVFPARWEGLHRVPPADTPEAETYKLRKLALLSERLRTSALLIAPPP